MKTAFPLRLPSSIGEPAPPALDSQKGDPGTKAVSGASQKDILKASLNAMLSSRQRIVRNLAVFSDTTVDPLHEKTLSGVAQFNDGNLIENKGRFSTNGCQGQVHMASYGSDQKINQVVVKSFRKNFGKDMVPNNLAVRTIDSNLGWNVIVDAKPGVISGKPALVMPLLIGSHPNRSYHYDRQDITDTEEGKALLAARFARTWDYSAQDMQMEQQALHAEMMLHSQGAQYSIQNSDQTIVMLSKKTVPAHVPPSLKKALIMLQVIDYLTGNIDRSEENYLLTEKAVGPKNDRHMIPWVTGIDHDLAFLREEGEDNEHWIGLPEYVDRQMADDILSLNKDALAASLGPWKKEAGISYIFGRLDTLREHIAGLERLGKIIDPKDWDAVDFKNKKTSYIARDL